MPLPIAAAATIGSGILNRIWSVKDQKRQRKWRQDEATLAYNRNLEQWNRQNVYNKEMWDMRNLYNTPESQMQRFKEAGLNPNLIYGRGDSGSAQPLETPTTAEYQAPRTDFNPSIPDFTNVLGQYQNFRMKNAQIDLVNQQAENAGITKWILGNQKLKGQIDVGKAVEFGRRGMLGPYYQKTQAQAGEAELRRQMKQFELNWWKSLQGIKGAGGIMRILKMIGGK